MRTMWSTEVDKWQTRMVVTHVEMNKVLRGRTWPYLYLSWLDEENASIVRCDLKVDGREYQDSSRFLTAKGCRSKARAKQGNADGESVDRPSSRKVAWFLNVAADYSFVLLL